MVTHPVGRRRRAMATVRPRITCRPTADILLRRDTATGRRRLTDITILPLRTTGVRRRSTFFAVDAAAAPGPGPAALRRRMGTITVLLRRACRVKTERRGRRRLRRLGRRVPRPAEVAGATAERTTKSAIMRAARSRMAAVARRLRRLTGIIPHITVAHRRDIPEMGRGLDTGVITVGRLLAIMLPTATVRLRRMAIRLTIRMVATGVRPLPVMKGVVMVAVLVLVLVPIRPSASPSAVVQKGATRQP